MKKFLLVSLSLLALSTPQVMAQIAGGNADRAFAQCGAFSDAAQRLACYDNARTNQPAPAPTSRYPEFGAAPPPRPQAAIAPPLPRNGKLTAGVVRYSVSSDGRFTIELDNGQVWKQNDADDETAQFKKGVNRVTISKGFWHSYDLRLNSMSAIFKVDRVK